MQTHDDNVRGTSRILPAARWIVGAVGMLAVIVMAVAIAAVVFPRVTGMRTLLIRSGSMTGTAPTGSLVFARSLEASDVQVDDVILMQREVEGRQVAPVLHRVIELSVNEASEIVVRTKGDANPDPDPEAYVLRGSTYTPALIVPRVGFVLATLRTPAGWFGFVVLPTIIGTIFWLRALWRKDESPEDNGAYVVTKLGPSLLPKKQAA
jgi:signal peptidase I